jgi:Ca-activated chloride channel family protein
VVAHLTQPLIIAIAAAVLILCVLGEALHARRTARVARLAFGPSGRPRAWTAAVAPARCLAAALAVWGLLTLASIDGAPTDPKAGKAPDRHLILALDVSPSMYIQDSGPDGKKTRQHRAGDVLQSVLERLDMTRTKVTIVAFYSTARPVVVDTGDLNVINNILYDLPLSQAFKEGQTNMYEGLRAAAKIAAPWRPGSATLILISDGDTLPDAGRVALPPSIGDALVVGVGNPYRASQVGEHYSRQDSSSLKRLAAQVHGAYHDGNVQHIPTATLRQLTMLGLKEDRTPRLRTVALTAVGTGATLLASISPLLAAFGVRRRGVGVQAARPTINPAFRSELEGKPGPRAGLAPSRPRTTGTPVEEPLQGALS